MGDAQVIWDFYQQVVSEHSAERLSEILNKIIKI